MIIIMIIVIIKKLNFIIKTIGYVLARISQNYDYTIIKGMRNGFYISR